MAPRFICCQDRGRWGRGLYWNDVELFCLNGPPDFSGRRGYEAFPVLGSARHEVTSAEPVSDGPHPPGSGNHLSLTSSVAMMK